jgi:formylmethanofuran dehydrogenase subunit C
VQRILGVLGLLVLLVALAGGVYLSQKNQEMRRGAAGKEGSVLFVPDNREIKVGKEFEAKILVDVKKMAGVGWDLNDGRIFVSYDRAVGQYLGVEAEAGFKVDELAYHTQSNGDWVDEAYRPESGDFGSEENNKRIKKDI